MTRFRRNSTAIIGRFYRGDEMDDYLSQLGLVRKINAKDESSLFRAIAEQLFLTQNRHRELREIANEFLESQKDQTSNNWNTSAVGIRKVYQFLVTLTKVLRHDIVIYRETGNVPHNVLGSSQYQSKVILCGSQMGYFDSVNTRNMHEHLGVAQAIVYEVLYAGVFGVSLGEIRGAINLIRNRQQTDDRDGTRIGAGYRLRMGSCPATGCCSSSDRDPSEFESSGEHGRQANEHSINMQRPPFPFRVAKALDPSIYRNVEYDRWLATKMAQIKAFNQPLRIGAGDVGSSPVTPISSYFVRGEGTTYLPYRPDSNQPIQSTIPPNPAPLRLSLVPIVTVPFFDMYMYGFVNREALPSSQMSGADLPLHDMTTLRFYYNLGVEYSCSAFLRSDQSMQSGCNLLSTPNMPQTPSSIDTPRTCSRIFDPSFGPGTPMQNGQLPLSAAHMAAQSSSSPMQIAYVPSQSQIVSTMPNCAQMPPSWLSSSM